MNAKYISALAMVLGGAAVSFFPDLAKPFLKELSVIVVIGLLAEMHKKRKKR